MEEFLKNYIEVETKHRQILRSDFLDPAIKILESISMNQGAINLKKRTTMPLEKVPKEKYRKKTDVFAALKFCKFTGYEYRILCLL